MSASEIRQKDSHMDTLLEQLIADFHECPLPQLTLREVRLPALLENRLRRYLLNGGFPEVQSVSDNHRIRILQEYLEYLMDAYLVYTVTLHSRSERVRRVNPRKIYAIDTGLANAFLRQPQTDWGDCWKISCLWN